MFPTNQNFVSANAGLSNGNSIAFPMYLTAAPTTQTINAPYGIAKIGQEAIVPGVGAWILISMTVVAGVYNATWIQYAGGTGDVFSVTGTANQILALPTSGNVVLSLIGPYSASSYTAHTVLLGEGTSAISMTAVGTDGQVLTGNTAADPTFNAIGTKSGLTLDGIILGGGTGPFTATSAGVAGQLLTSNGVGVSPTFQSAGLGLTSDYADFYALMPGDNAATVAVGAAIELPNNGSTSGTIITRLSATTFNLADIATYSISFQCSFDEAGQMMLKLNGAEVATTVSGRATGTNQVYISCLLTTTVINSVLSVVNPSGNVAALTITPIAGGTHAVSAHLVIQRVAGGVGGGLMNTLNSVAPLAGNINIVGTANQTTVTAGVGIVTLTTPTTFIAPGSIAATTTLTATLGAITATNGNLVLGTAGNKILSTSVGTTIAAGANSFGSVVLVGGSAIVSTTAVTTNSLIFLSRLTVGATGAAALGMLSVGTIVNGTSFVINAWQTADATALAATDVSVICYMIVN